MPGPNSPKTPFVLSNRFMPDGKIASLPIHGPCRPNSDSDRPRVDTALTYRYCWGYSGGAERDRTVDLLNAIQALSQLSYGPTEAGESSGWGEGVSNLEHGAGGHGEGRDGGALRERVVGRLAEVSRLAAGMTGGELREAAGDLGAQGVEAFAGEGGDPEALAVLGAGGGQGSDAVALVEDGNDAAALDAELVQDLVGDSHLVVPLGVAAVDDVQDEVGGGDLAEGAAEGRDEVMRELADEADGVGEDRARAGRGFRAGRTVGAVRAEVAAAELGVEGGEEAVLGEGVGGGEAVEEGRLAGVGVAGEGDDGHASAAVALDAAGAVDAGEVLF